MPSYAKKTDFVIITSLQEELEAVLKKLRGYRRITPIESDIYTYFSADLPVRFSDSSTGEYQVIVVSLVHMGQVQATAVTQQAISRWNPRFVIVVGIAGGMSAKGIKIGDILIADQILDYEIQKVTPTSNDIRWEVHRADSRLLNAYKSMLDENWQELIEVKRPGPEAPSRYLGPIASGDKIIANEKVLKKFRRTWSKCIGVEMEAAGAATAAFQSPAKPGFFMVRGVSDLADENKNSAQVEMWRPYACDIAASFTIAFLKNGPVTSRRRPKNAAKIVMNRSIPQGQTREVLLVLDGYYEYFTESRKLDIVKSLADILEIHQDDVKILEISKGSIVASIVLPTKAVDHLSEMVTKRDPRIIGLGILSLTLNGQKISLDSQSMLVRYTKLRSALFVNRLRKLQALSKILYSSSDRSHGKKDEEIASLLKETEDFLGYLTTQDDTRFIGYLDHQKMSRLDHRIGLLTTELSEISYLNQEKELEKITDPLGKDFLLIEAPMGYGKSFILNQAQKKLEKDGWTVIRVDFKETPLAAENQTRFLTAICDNLLSRQGNLPCLSPGNPIQQKNALFSQLALAGPKLCIMLDGAEKVTDPEMISYIRDQILFAGQKAVLGNNINAKYRCVVSGRHISNYWNPQSSKFTVKTHFAEPIRLRDFGYDVVADAVNNLLNATQPPEIRRHRPDTSIDRLVRSVLMITGGHPECMTSILIDLCATQNLILPNPLSIDDHVLPLFKEYVDPICELTLADFPPPLQQLLPAISVFRCYDFNILKEVLQWMDDNHKLVTSEFLDPEKVFRVMTGLSIVKYDNQKFYWTDSVVRRMLLFREWLKDLREEDKSASELNRFAKELYLRWLRSKTTQEVDRIKTVLQEHLYHCSVEIARSSGDGNTQILEFKKQVIEDFGLMKNHDSIKSHMEDEYRWLEYVSALKRSLQEDSDILFQLQHIQPEVDMQDIFSSITA